MLRWRHWPTALGLIAALMLVGYLLYSEWLMREMRRDAVAHSRIYARVLGGLANPAEGAAEITLLNLIDEVKLLGVPLVLTDAEGLVVGAENLPFEADLGTDEGQRRIQRYLRGIIRRNPPISEGSSYVFVDDPPILRRLRWIPWLQVGSLLGLLFYAWWVVRHNQRVERERLWAAMARESAHQMGTPLSSLEGWVEILRLPPDQREELASLPVLAAEMEADLERLQKVSRRFEWIGRSLRREAVDVGVLLRSLERYVRVRLPQLAGAVDLRLNLPDELPPVLGNAILLEWALENLVKNALDALAGSGGTITIRPEAQGQRRVTITVSDTGPGIAPAVRSTLFEPGVSTKRGGWGVGLSLARRIIRDVHLGELELLPAERGATFLITLPVAAAAVAAEESV